MRACARACVCAAFGRAEGCDRRGDSAVEQACPRGCAGIGGTAKQRRPAERRRQPLSPRPAAGVSGEREAGRHGVVAPLAWSPTRRRGRQGACRTRGCKGGPSPDAHPSQGLASHPKAPVDALPRRPPPPPFLPRRAAAPCLNSRVFLAASLPQEPGQGGARRRAEREGAGGRPRRGGDRGTARSEIAVLRGPAQAPRRASPG